MKNFVIVFCLIFLISFTAIIKTSSKKIEEKIFILNENLSLLKEKYNLLSLEHTYLSNPSRLISIMKNHKNEEYIHDQCKDIKIIKKKKMTNNKEKKIYLAVYNDEFSFSKKIYKKNISFNRIAFIFFFFLFISLVFSVKIFYYGSISEKKLSQTKINQENNIRSDIIDIKWKFFSKNCFYKKCRNKSKLENDKKKLFYKIETFVSRIRY